MRRTLSSSSAELSTYGPDVLSYSVGYVNELLSRLTGDRSYVLADQTQVNQTLARSQWTFPIGANAPAIFADFSHDNEITSILAAIGLKKPAAPLAASGPSADQVWVTSEIVSFSGRLVTERLSCGGDDFVRFFIVRRSVLLVCCSRSSTSLTSSPRPPPPPSSSRRSQNDQLQIPSFCAGADSQTGLCPLEAFVESQSYARASGNGDYLKVRSHLFFLVSCLSMSASLTTSTLSSRSAGTCLCRREEERRACAELGRRPRALFLSSSSATRARRGEM